MPKLRMSKLGVVAGDYRTCLEAKAQAVAEALTRGDADFAFLHVKAVDDAGHDRDPTLKARPARYARWTATEDGDREH